MHNWQYNEKYRSWVLTEMIFNKRQGWGSYEIWIQPRPSYCDRGDWIIHVDCRNGDLDGADGFPRYFFGTVEEAQRQMETWLWRREAYRAAQQQTKR
jgi:hypothetical protein